MTSPSDNSNTPRTPSAARKQRIKLTPLELEALSVYDVAEVSDLLRITSDTVRREIRAGILQAENYGSGSRPVYRIPRAALEQWRASRMVQGTK